MVIKAAHVAYILLLKMKNHPVYCCILLLLDRNGNTVHTLHYKEDEGEEIAQETARALCAGYALQGCTTIEVE